jgi:hypothetical protein
MREVKEANEKLGRYWFSEETMKYWGTHIHTDILYGKYFVTSEWNFERTKRLFSIREVRESGAISTLEFQSFNSCDSAERYLDRHVKK